MGDPPSPREERQIKNIQHLYKKAVTLADPNKKGSLNESDQKWLQEALTTMSVDIVEKIKNSWSYLKDELYANNIEGNDNFHDELDMFNDMLEHEEYAKIFFCVDGLDDITKLLKHSTFSSLDGTTIMCMNMLKNCFANNQFCQELAFQSGFAPQLLTMTVNYAQELEKNSQLFFSSLETLGALLSGSNKIYPQLKSNERMKELVEKILPNMLFVENVSGPRDNIIRFYYRIIVLDPIDLPKFFLNCGYLDALIKYINGLFDKTINPQNDKSHYLQFLSNLLTSLKQENIIVDSDVRKTISAQVSKWKSKCADCDYLQDCLGELERSLT